jgi:hypothetical protein
VGVEDGKFAASRRIEACAAIIAEECLQHGKLSSRPRGLGLVSSGSATNYTLVTTHHIRSSNLCWSIQVFVFATVCLGEPKPTVIAPNYNALTFLSTHPSPLYLPGYHPYCGYVTRLKKTVILVSLQDETGCYQNRG